MRILRVLLDVVLLAFELGGFLDTAPTIAPVVETKTLCCCGGPAMIWLMACVRPVMALPMAASACAMSTCCAI
jgi:hypothetical protein